MTKSLRLLVLFFLLFQVACSDDKSSESVFPNEGSQDFDGSCSQNLVAGEFVALWEDGTVTKEFGVDREQMLKDFVEPNLANLKRVGFNYHIKLDTQFDTKSSERNWHLDDINSHYAWDQNIKGQDVLVAVIDTGVDISHPDISGKIYINEGEKPFNGIDDDGNGFIDDYQGYDFFRNSGSMSDPQGHGTHVAGIIAGDHQVSPASPIKGTNGVFGVAPEAKILPIRFLGDNGSGDLADAIKAVDYASRMGAKIINASWGNFICSQVLQDKIVEIENNNVLFIAASGNSGRNADFSPEYPAAFVSNNILSVAATSEIGAIAYFSNYGLTSVDVGAPGEDIYSLAPNSGATTLSGTSMATPVVAGIAAMIKSVKPEATYAEIKNAIEASVTPTRIQVKSRGTVNVEKALKYIGF